MIGMVVPCFNEEMRINLSYWTNLIESSKSVHWIFVNDGSKDNTFAKLSQLATTNAHVLNLEVNGGKSQAISVGFSKLISMNLGLSSIGYLDSDSAFDSTEVLDVLVTSKRIFDSNHDLAAIFTSRVSLAGRNIHRSLLRHYLGRVIATYVTWGWPGAPYDTQSGFKIYRYSESFINLKDHSFRTRWFFDLELLSAFGSLREVKLFEIPLSSWTEVPGTKLKVRNYFSVFRDVLTIKVILSRNLKSGL